MDAKYDRQMRINIKPLSVNQAWMGRRFKTKQYKDYESQVLLMLKPYKLPRYDNLHIDLEFGFSNKGSDIDNPIKPILDILQKKYKFNDSRIYSMFIEKKIVKKGHEYIYINISAL